MQMQFLWERSKHGEHKLFKTGYSLFFRGKKRRFWSYLKAMELTYPRTTKPWESESKHVSELFLCFHWMQMRTWINTNITRPGNNNFSLQEPPVLLCSWVTPEWRINGIMIEQTGFGAHGEKGWPSSDKASFGLGKINSPLSSAPALLHSLGKDTGLLEG